MQTDYAQRILDLTKDGLQVFMFYIDTDFKVKKRFINPYYPDTKPSCHIYFDTHSGRYMMHDFGDATYHGDCFWLVAMLNGLDCRHDFMQVVRIINRDMHLGLDSELGGDTLPAAPDARRLIQRLSRDAGEPGREERPQRPRPYKFEAHEMTPEETIYWERYGITPETLDRYSVRALTSFSSEGENGPYTIRPAEGRLMFGYCQERFMKVYRPQDSMRFLYAGRKPRDYCFGFQQLPASGDIVFITGGEKDVLSLSSHGFSAVCFNSETAAFPKEVISILEQRFRHIIVMFDADETGVRSMKSALEEWRGHGFMSITLPLAGTKKEKDISDFFAMGHTPEDLRKIVSRTVTEKYGSTRLMIQSCEMDLRRPPEESECIVMAGGVPLVTSNSLVCVAGGEGTGKSNLVSSLIAGAVLTGPQESPIDTLGFTVLPNTRGHAVLQFDTEQSEQQLYRNTMMTKRRAGIEGDLPDFFHAFHLTPYKREMRLGFIRDTISLYHQRHGGIHMVVIDGVADLVRSANDEAGSIALVDDLYRLAVSYHTSIICVLHYVPGNTKLRGHLGSELQRKAATILAVEKEYNSPCNTIRAVKVREGNPRDVPVLEFSWNKEADMFRFVGRKGRAESAESKREVLQRVIATLFPGGREKYTYKDLTDRITEEINVRARTAKAYIADLYSSRTIVKLDGKYILNNDPGPGDAEEE